MFQKSIYDDSDIYQTRINAIAFKISRPIYHVITKTIHGMI